VRNSGAEAVVEGVGDHALEYMTGGCAVILGAIGRNLGAGMSGGIAFIYKLRADRINRESLESGEIKLEQLEATDAAKLRGLLELHMKETGSAVAERILNDFENELRNFTKVMPRDYAAVLSIRSEAIAQEQDPDSEFVWSKILEVTGG
jgi:glutamate synthase (NADPH/NADH) large chain